MYDIKVDQFGHTFDCEEDETILEAALRNRVFLRYGCKHGGCGTCKVQLVDGDVELTASSYSLPPGERDAGTILVCQSYPLDDCVLDVAAMNLDEEEFFKGDGTADRATVVESVDKLTHDITRIVLRHPDGQMPFTAGQFVNVTVPGHDVQRSYSMANGSAAADRIDLICKILPGGLFSRYLEEDAKPGDEVTVSGPYGMLSVRLSYREIVMVAGGSGLAPLLSMLTDLADKKSERPVTLFFGARTPDDLYCTEEIEALKERLPLFTFHPGGAGAFRRLGRGDRPGHRRAAGGQGVLGGARRLPVRTARHDRRRDRGAGRCRRASAERLLRRVRLHRGPEF